MGYAVMRRCRRGYKIGPLTALDEATAETLFTALAAEAQGEPISSMYRKPIRVPSRWRAAME